MKPPLPPCPHLPPAPLHLDSRHVGSLGAERGEAFYRCCLEWAQSLWQRRLPARAVLALDRALHSSVAVEDAVLLRWPLPYAAMTWMLRLAPEEAFLGNPRVHFQHLADRLQGPRRELRRSRTWACWHLARHHRPEFPPDPRHAVREPTVGETAAELGRHGHPGERELWLQVLPGAGVFST